jgi:cellulose synthase/poly-beta-1,6-N-acetylglucosamine synthase-like glycosyltransferase
LYEYETYQSKSESLASGQVSRRSVQELALPTVTVVICTRCRPNLLRECLTAVSKLSPPPDDVLVVDNSPSDEGTRNTAKEFLARYTIEPVRGLSRARNRGMTESTTDIVAYLDDDASPCEDWLRHLLEPFSDPLVAVVAGETTDTGTGPVPIADPTRTPVRVLSNRDPLWFETAAFGGLGIGTNMAFRKSVQPRFDLRLGRGTPIRTAEEDHVFVSLLSRGYRAVHVPAAAVTHPATPMNVEKAASSAMAYWLLLFFEIPGHKLDLVRFLFRRLRGVHLSWQRTPSAPGQIMKSGWRLKFRAGFRGLRLYLQSRKHGQTD